MKAYNFYKAQQWWMSDDRKADKKTNRSFKRSERNNARRNIRAQADTLFLVNGHVYDHAILDDIDILLGEDSDE